MKLDAIAIPRFHGFFNSTTVRVVFLQNCIAGGKRKKTETLVITKRRLHR